MSRCLRVVDGDEILFSFKEYALIVPCLAFLEGDCMEEVICSIFSLKTRLFL